MLSVEVVAKDTFRIPFFKLLKWLVYATFLSACTVRVVSIDVGRLEVVLVHSGAPLGTRSKLHLTKRHIIIG